MKFVMEFEDLSSALRTIKPFVSSANTAASLAMSCVRVIATTGEAPEDGQALFVGHNGSQGVGLPMKAKVLEPGDVLFSIADASRVMSAIGAEKAASVTVELEDCALALRTTRTSTAAVSVVDISRVGIRPMPPVRQDGSLLSIKVDGDSFCRILSRTIPGTVGSRFPNLMLWVEEGQLCAMGVSSTMVAFASTSGAEVSGDLELTLWSPANLKRLMDLMPGAKEVHIQHERDARGEPKLSLSITINYGDGSEIVIEQEAERTVPEYEDAKAKMRRLARTAHDASTTRATASRRAWLQALDSAMKVASIKDGMGNLVTVTLDEGGVATIELPSGALTREIDLDKVSGVLPSTFSLDAGSFKDLLGPLPDAAAVVLYAPDMGKSPKGYALVTDADVTVINKSGELPAYGYWGVFFLTQAALRK